ncbi:DedA family protein [Mycobacterium ostraviense]|uniref:DedA family protein n=1 Tax=Mycobacterium ostraviense TaxID=2738409 RepID=UPI001912F332|nr:hypothetical protein [Mycobacterium ostraviense]UGT90907.1 hypothetical protein LTS72_22115 [Mycobacterium ostraviense]
MWRFLAFNALGGVAWVALWVLVGYLAGDHIGAIYADFQRYEKYVWAASAVLVVALLVRWLVKRRSGHDTEAQEAQDVPCASH